MSAGANRLCKRGLLRLGLCGLLFAALPLPAQAPPSAWGSLYIHQPGMRSPAPAGGYVVYLYSNRMRWSRPSYTDGYGRYAHYGVPAGKYLLRILNYHNQIVWQQDVMIGTGSTQIPPITLSQP
jgi:hypothetical protein